MGKRIEVVAYKGSLIVQAFGFDPNEYVNGLPSCEAATQPLEDRLGRVTQRERKEELAATQCGLTTEFCG